MPSEIGVTSGSTAIDELEELYRILNGSDFFSDREDENSLERRGAAASALLVPAPLHPPRASHFEAKPSVDLEDYFGILALSASISFWMSV